MATSGNGALSTGTRIPPTGVNKLERLIREESTNCTQLGIQLGIDLARLQTLEAQSTVRKNLKECFQEMCGHWLSRQQEEDEDRTWSEVYEALEAQDNFALKENLERAHPPDAKVVLKDLVNGASEMTSEWYEFGCALGVSITDLDTIKDQGGLQRYMIAMLKEWIRIKQSEATWENMQKALKNIGNHRLAASLQKQIGAAVSSKPRAAEASSSDKYTRQAFYQRNKNDDLSSQPQPLSRKLQEPSYQANSPATQPSSDDCDDGLRFRRRLHVNNDPPATRGYTPNGDTKVSNCRLCICGVFLILVIMGLIFMIMYIQLPKNGQVDLVADPSHPTVKPSMPEPRAEQSTIPDNCHPISKPTDVFLFLKEEFQINDAMVFGLLLKLTNTELVRLKEDCKHEQAIMFLNHILVAWYGKTSPPACWETIYDALWELPNRPLANKVKKQYLK